MNVTIFSSHGFERPFIDRANAGRFAVRHIIPSLDITTVDLAQGADVVALFANDDCSAPVLRRLHELGVRYLALRSAGFNHVDLATARTLGLRAANVPEYSPYSVAEHTVALILALNRKVIRAHARVRDLNFSLDGLTGFDIHGKTVGVIGLGRIGKSFARIMRGFGCRMLGFDMYPDPDFASEINLNYTDVESLCRESDIISLHVPLTPDTKYIINADRIKLMKKGVMLINTSRGALVNTRDVIHALKTHHIGYLGLDVYEEERGLFFEDHSDTILQDDVIARLMTFPNVLITSHQAFLTETALTNIADTTFASIEAWSKGQSSPTELVTG